MARDPRKPVNATAAISPPAGIGLTAAAAVTAVTVVSALASLGFSRVTGWASHTVTVPVGTWSLLTATVLTMWAPARFGWVWADTVRRWRLIAAALAGVVAVVGLFRMVSPAAPYEPSIAEFLLVPIGTAVSTSL